MRAVPSSAAVPSPAELHPTLCRVTEQRAALHLAHRRQNAATQTWAKQADWSSMSQGRRMLRWLTSRQARPVTMHAIAAAFGRSK